MKRRSLLASGSAALLAGLRYRPARAASPTTLIYVPASNLTLLDPVWSTAYVSLCHGYAVFDAPYGADAHQAPQPQMLEGHESATDGRSWTLRLREGLRFHDGEPVRAVDMAASLVRWSARQATGQVVGAFVDNWTLSCCLT